MKWILASERLPDLYPVNNSDKLHYKLDGVKVDGFFLHQRCFEYFDTTIDGYSTVEFEGFARVKWLDESPAQPNGDEVVKFAEWILKEAILPRDINWFDAGKHYTSEQLYELFKNRNNV